MPLYPEQLYNSNFYIRDDYFTVYRRCNGSQCTWFIWYPHLRWYYTHIARTGSWREIFATRQALAKISRTRINLITVHQRRDQLMMVFLHGFIICFMFNDENFKKFYLYGQDFILITVIYLNILERSAFWRNPLPSTSNIPNIVCNFSWQDPEIKKNYWHYNLCVPKLCIMYALFPSVWTL